jgi:hypothetical protein
MVALPKRLQAQSPSHARAPKQEAETAKRFGGKTTLASGALHIKGDVRIRDVARIENKTTIHKSFSVNVEHIQKLDAAILGTSEIPMMSIELLQGKCKFCVIPDSYMDTIVEALKFYNENH